MDVRSPRSGKMSRDDRPRSPRRHKRKSSPRSWNRERARSPRSSDHERARSPRSSDRERARSPRSSDRERARSPRSSDRERARPRFADPEQWTETSEQRQPHPSDAPASSRAQAQPKVDSSRPPSRPMSDTDDWERPSRAESSVSLSDQHKLVLAVEYVAEYISDTLGPTYAPWVRYAIVCRAHQYDNRGMTPMMVLSACRRYVVENETKLPMSRGQRAGIIRDQVARKLGKSPSAVYPFALAVTARMSKVPPRHEVTNTERQIFSGNVPTVEDNWMSSDCTLSRTEFREQLIDIDEDALRETCVSFGLQRESVDVPEIQRVSLRLLKCGCHDALPMINASINEILSGTTPVERFYLRSVRSPKAEPMSPRTRRRALCEAALGPPQVQSNA